jgi:hypothetical protein
MAENSIVSARVRRRWRNPAQSWLDALRSAPRCWKQARVFRDLGGQRVNPSGSVQELAVRPGNRPNANEDVADPRKPQSASPLTAP